MRISHIFSLIDSHGLETTYRPQKRMEHKAIWNKLSRNVSCIIVLAVNSLQGGDSGGVLLNSELFSIDWYEAADKVWREK